MLQPRLSLLRSSFPRTILLVRSAPARRPSSPFPQLRERTAGRGYSTGQDQVKVSKAGKRARNAAVLLGVGVGIYAWDRQFNAEAITRTMRTAYHA